MRRLALALGLVLLLAFPAWAQDARPDKAVGLTVNGQQVWLRDVPPFIKDGRTMLPVRGVFETMGVEVRWDDAARSVVATKDGKTLQMWPDNAVYTIDGAEAGRLDVPPHIYDGRTFVPGRAIFEAFGATVNWDPDWREARVTFDGEARQPGPDTNAELPVTTVGSIERGWRLAFFKAAPDALQLPAYLSYDGKRFPDGLRIEGNDPSPTTRDQRWTPGVGFTANSVWPVGETGLLQRGPVTFEKFPGEVGEPLLTFGVWRLSKEPVEFSFPLADFLFSPFVWDWPVAELANGVGAGRGRAVWNFYMGTGNMLGLSIDGGPGAPLLWRPLEMAFALSGTPWYPAPGRGTLERDYWEAKPFPPLRGPLIRVRVTSAWLWFDGFSLTQDLREAPFEGVPQVSDYFWRQARQP